MTASPESASVSAPLDRRWREQAERRQQAALPSGRVAVSCSAPLGTGGLGRHLKEVVDALQRSASPTVCICASTREQDPRPGSGRPSIPDPATLLARSPIPLSLGLRTRAFMVEFDAYAARRLPTAEHLIAFNGQALTQFKAARRAGYQSRALVSANSHLRRVARQHARARRLYPLEGSWATHLVRRNCAEYAQADRIYVASEYTRQSFLEEGFSDESLSRFQFTPDPRYRPSASPPSADTFNIVYVGSLSVVKGVPLLIDAVRRLPHTDVRLVLVGGWGTRGMRRFIQGACAEDPRISSGAGRPAGASARRATVRPPQLRGRLRVRARGGARLRCPGDRQRGHRNEGSDRFPAHRAGPAHGRSGRAQRGDRRRLPRRDPAWIAARMTSANSSRTGVV